METRFVVQIKAGENDWKDYRKTRRSKAYTLTQEEAVAFMNTLPQTVKVWTKSVTVDIATDVVPSYRVIKSVKVNGLINQAIVAGDNS